MDKIKITEHQLFSITANGAMGGSIIVISSLLTSIAKQDAWIAGILTPAFGILVIWVMGFIGSKFPGETFIGIIRNIFGKWIGLFFSVNFVFLCLLTACHIPWYISNFITTQFMPETPAYAVNSIFVAAVVLAVLYGIESIARASELFLYTASTLFFSAIILVSPNAKIENLQPVLEKGIIPVMKSSVFLSGILTFPLFTLMMIYPVNLNNLSQARRSIYKGYLWAGFIVFISILMTILVLGAEITAKSQHPTYLLAKEINVGEIFTRFEAVIAAAWIITEFSIGILFFYAGVIGLSQLLGLKDHKRIVIPLGLITFVMSGVVLPDTVYQANWFSLVWTPYSITFGLILPVLLLLVFCIKKLIFKNR